MMDRYEAVDWYKDGRPKTYRDNDTGEEVSLHEYRKRRRETLAVDEGPDEPDDELETQAFADPAPRPRLFDVSAPRDERPPSATPGVRRMGLTEMFAPALAGFATSVALIRLRESPRQVFVPPKEVTTPIIAPVGRIIDRHLPTELSILMGEDGKDVTACLTAIGAGMVWFRDAVEAYERYRYGQQQPVYDERPTGRPARDTAPKVDDTAGTWAGDIFQRVRNGSPADAGDDAAARAADAPRVREVGSDEAASRVRDLLSADAAGVMFRGLADQS